MTAYYNEYDKYAAERLRNLIAAGRIAPGVVGAHWCIASQEGVAVGVISLKLRVDPLVRANRGLSFCFALSLSDKPILDALPMDDTRVPRQVGVTSAMNRKHAEIAVFGRGKGAHHDEVVAVLLRRFRIHRCSFGCDMGIVA